jgi:hypothetical protein
MPPGTNNVKIEAKKSKPITNKLFFWSTYAAYAVISAKTANDWI